MKKNEKKLIGCLLIILVIVLAIYFIANGKKEAPNAAERQQAGTSQKEAGEQVETEDQETEDEEPYVEKNYELKVNSKDYGSPEEGATIFATNFNIENVEGTCRVDYIGLYPDSVESNYPDLNSYKQVEINGKKFSYKEEDANEVNLIYEQNENCYVIIRVDLIGNENAKIDKAVLQSAELAKAIDFTVTEK